MIERLLREAYEDAAQTVRPERVRPLAPLGRRRRRRLTIFAPLAAAAAVVVAVAAALAVPRLAGSAPEPTAATAPDGLPPFLVVLALTSTGPLAYSLEVVSAANGKVLATVPSPGKDDWQYVTASGNGTTFFAATDIAAAGKCASAAHFYRLTLSASGQPASLTPLTTAVVPLLLEQAIISADGSTIAYLGQSCHPARGQLEEAIGIIRGGGTRQWSVPAGSNVPGVYLSLSADGDALGYLSEKLGSNQTSAHILSIRSGVDRTVTQVPDGTYVATAVISDNGTTMYLVTTHDVQIAKMNFVLAGYQPGREYGKPFRWHSSNVDWKIAVAGTQLVVWPAQTFDGAKARPYLVDPVTGKDVQLWSPQTALRNYYVAW